MRTIAVHDDRTYQYIQIETAITIEISKRSRIRPPRPLFQLGDDFHATDFGTSRYRATGKNCADGLSGRHVFPQQAPHVGHNVVDVRITFHNHHLVDLNRAGFTDAPKVIALEIDQHDMFGPLFRV